MNEIIKVERKEGIETVNARELHGFLEVGRDFSTWIKDRIEQYGFLENVDYAVSKSIPQNGGTAIEYHISLDMAKELSMVERNEKGRIARKYFIECEKKLNISNSVLLPLLEEMKIRLDRIESKQIANAPAKNKKPVPKRAKIIKYFKVGNFDFIRVECGGKLFLITPNYHSAYKYNVTFDEGRYNSQPIKTGLLSEKQALAWIERNF